MKDKITIEIDLGPIREHANKYIKKKVIAELKEYVETIVNDANYPNIILEDRLEELEKLKDWKRDIEQGWIDLGQYCNKCKENKHKFKGKTLKEMKVFREKLKMKGLLFD